MYLVYITFPNRNEAISVSHALVKEKLLACANISSEVTSIYNWEGEIQEDLEVVLIGKTRAEVVDYLFIRLKELHSYASPAIIAMKIDKVDPVFKKWVSEATTTYHDS